MTWSIKILRAGTMRLDGGGMFGVVPKTMWERLSPPDDHNRILLQTNCLLLEQSGTKVLVEAGCGDKWSEKERGIYAIENRTVGDDAHLSSNPLGTNRFASSDPHWAIFSAGRTHG